MGEWNIYIVNTNGEGGKNGRSVKTMIFQTVPDPLIVDSLSTAWIVGDIPYPGEMGPTILPEDVVFYVLDKADTRPRETGPFPVKFGQIIEVTQKSKSDRPTVVVSGKSQPGEEIKTTNMKGNVQPLEMALYKDGRKIVSFKVVEPGDAVYLAIQPVIYIADISGKGMEEGEEFKAVVQAAQSTVFELSAEKRDVKIGIVQKASGEVNFILLDQ